MKKTTLTPAAIRVVAIGASTGGPLVLQTILSELPVDFTVPILVVQHIKPGFLDGMVDWLRQATGKQICIASRGEHILPGHVYFAPDSLHMMVEKGDFITLNDNCSGQGPKPAVSRLFQSVLNIYGRNSAGILLTGLGDDGAKELKLMRETGAITIAQDKASSIVYGMPGEAVHLDAAMYVQPPHKIARLLGTLGKC